MSATEHTYRQHAGDTQTLTFDFSTRLGADETLTGVAVSVADIDGRGAADATTTAMRQGNLGLVNVTTPTPGRTYRISCAGTTTAAQRITLTAKLAVRG